MSAHDSTRQWLLTGRSGDGAAAPFAARIESAGRDLPSSRPAVAERDPSVEPSLVLAIAAARDAIARSDHEGRDLEVVIGCTTAHRGGEQWLEPAMSLSVARAVGAAEAITFDIGNARAGMLTGVFLLDSWIRIGFVERGMVVSGEADAGAALVLERAPAGDPGISVTGFRTIAGQPGPTTARTRATTERAARGPALPSTLVTRTPDLLQTALDAAGVSIDDIDCVIPHQGPTRPIAVDRHGNTASTTHTVALVEELRAGRLHAGDRVALVALDSGLEIGVVVLTVDDQLVRDQSHPR